VIDRTTDPIDRILAAMDRSRRIYIDYIDRTHYRGDRIDPIESIHVPFKKDPEEEEMRMRGKTFFSSKEHYYYKTVGEF
jgi:hypothetical protein